ncbi:unnamed protein product [Bursaphelenchus okinawaensis]|uniref:G_PROTEIN_RECEP_F1_2 domain-containing protein n=1 Tax=Bursaphelenchus okinawaensis TaxID=465554 RepID=A0A811JVN6_9BILA|nr:unnamed protein product [Bursaphelenchus okinawaensis]CAG9085326.1 unnamed protein product [Bursaphelenchus okinawaensis]
MEVIYGVVSILLNGAVLIVATQKHKGIFNSYSTLVICTTFTDLCFSIINLIVMEVPECRDSGIFFFNDNPLISGASSATALKLTSLWLLGVYTSIMNIGFQFYHRYKVIAKGCPGSRKEVFISFGICLSISFVLSFSEIFTLIPGRENENYVKELEDDIMFDGKVVSFSVSDPKNPKCLFHLMLSQIFITAVYGTVIYCSVSIMKALGSAGSKMSKNTIQGNRTLNRAMFIQAVFPFVLIGIPYVFGLLGTFLHIKLPVVALVGSLLMAFLPIANALTLLTTIPSYRRKFFEILGIKGSKIQSSTTQISRTKVSDTNEAL